MAKGGFRGDAKPLADIIKRAGRVASGELAAKSAHRFGEVVYDLNAATVAAGKTPTGKAWKKTVDGRAPLSRARSEFGIEYWKGGFKLKLPAPYKFHQAGAYRADKDNGRAVQFGHRKAEWRLPVRMLMPARGRAVPRRWRKPVIAALDELWFKAMK